MDVSDQHPQGLMILFDRYTAAKLPNYDSYKRLMRRVVETPRISVKLFGVDAYLTLVTVDSDRRNLERKLMRDLPTVTEVIPIDIGSWELARESALRRVSRNRLPVGYLFMKIEGDPDLNSMIREIDAAKGPAIRLFAAKLRDPRGYNFACALSALGVEPLDRSLRMVRLRLSPTGFELLLGSKHGWFSSRKKAEKVGITAKELAEQRRMEEKLRLFYGAKVGGYPLPDEEKKRS